MIDCHTTTVTVYSARYAVLHAWYDILSFSHLSYDRFKSFVNGLTEDVEIVSQPYPHQNKDVTAALGIVLLQDILVIMNVIFFTFVRRQFGDSIQTLQIIFDTYVHAQFPFSV